MEFQLHKNLDEQSRAGAQPPSARARIDQTSLLETRRRAEKALAAQKAAFKDEDEVMKKWIEMI